MTFEEWYEANQHDIPFDDKELGAAWELLTYIWNEGYDQGVAASDPAVYVPTHKGPLSALDGLPGMDGYVYQEFSKDSDRW